MFMRFLCYLALIVIMAVLLTLHLVGQISLYQVMYLNELRFLIVCLVILLLNEIFVIYLLLRTNNVFLPQAFF